MSQNPVTTLRTKNENYINILKNENTELDNKLKKVNQLVSKLKLQISENEKEKNLILTSSNQKEKDLELIKKQLEQAKSQVDELKNKNKEKLSSLEDQNNILKKNSEFNANTIVELQQKITDLEFKLKASSSNINKKFSYLADAHNCSLILGGNPQKNTTSSLPEILNFKFDNGDDGLFLTGRNELLEMKESNKNLMEQLNILQTELNKHQIDKENMVKELDKYNKEKQALLDDLNKKNEIFNTKKREENELNNNLMKQLIENKKIKNSLDNIKIKYRNLEIDKKELEDIILEQENKVNELSSSVKKIVDMVNIKNNEINNNKTYIKNLEETIRDLNREFYNMRMRKKKENSKEIIKLKTQLENLKKENQKLIQNNPSNSSNNETTSRNFDFFPNENNNHILSRNIKIKNINNNKYKKIRIKLASHDNQNKSKFLSSAFDMDHFIDTKNRKKEEHLLKLKINKRNNKKDYYYNYNISPPKKNIINEGKNLNIINLNNIKIKNLGNLKYNKSVLNLNKLTKRLHSSSVNEITSNDRKFESEESTNDRHKLKKLNSIKFKSRIINDKTSATEGTNKSNNINFISNNKNLIDFSKNEKIEKEKIQEFKDFLQQIVYDIES